MHLYGVAASLFAVLLPSTRLVSAGQNLPPHDTRVATSQVLNPHPMISEPTPVPPLARTSSQSNRNLADLHSAHQDASITHETLSAHYAHAKSLVRLHENHVLQSEAMARNPRASPPMRDLRQQTAMAARQNLPTLRGDMERRRRAAKNAGYDLAGLHDGFREAQYHHVGSGWGEPADGLKLVGSDQWKTGREYVNSRQHVREHPEIHI